MITPASLRLCNVSLCLRILCTSEHCSKPQPLLHFPDATSPRLIRAKKYLLSHLHASNQLPSLSPHLADVSWGHLDVISSQSTSSPPKLDLESYVLQEYSRFKLLFRLICVLVCLYIFLQTSHSSKAKALISTLAMDA